MTDTERTKPISIFKAEADYIEEPAKVVRLETELAEARAEIERLTVLLTFPSYQMYCPYRASIKIC